MNVNERMQAAAELAAILLDEARAQEAKTPVETPWPTHWAARDALTLMAISRRMENLSIRQCNYGFDDADAARAERARDKAAKQIADIGKPYGFKGCSVCGDPRGFVVRVELASGHKNGWGDGYGIAG